MEHSQEFLLLRTKSIKHNRLIERESAQMSAKGI